VKSGCPSQVELIEFTGSSEVALSISDESNAPFFC